MSKWFLQKRYKPGTPCILLLDRLPGKPTKHGIDEEFVDVESRGSNIVLHPVGEFGEHGGIFIIASC